MITLLSPHYVLEPVTRTDIILASLAWGFTLGIGWITTWTAMKQTKQVWRRHRKRIFKNAYIWMIWLEILVCLIFGVICFLYLLYVIPPSFAFYFTILTTWALQVQFLLQIIVNRCAILMTNKKKANRIKWGVAALITAVNISVYNIWIPARLQISEDYIHINEWWDRCEKVIYLIVDACLNFYFIHIVRANLVLHGLTKYRSLVHFNMFIVGFSLSMDVFIIAMMSLSNSFVYMQVHPLAYIVKLNIEMSMADLIGKIARNRSAGVISDGAFSDTPPGSANQGRRRHSMTFFARARRHRQRQNRTPTESGTRRSASDGGINGGAGDQRPFGSDKTTLIHGTTPSPNSTSLETPPETYVSYGIGRDGDARTVRGDRNSVGAGIGTGHGDEEPLGRHRTRYSWPGATEGTEFKKAEEGRAGLQPFDDLEYEQLVVMDELEEQRLRDQEDEEARIGD